MNNILYGFHSITARLNFNSKTIRDIYFDLNRNDYRMKKLLDLAKKYNINLISVDKVFLQNLSKTKLHQGVVAKTNKILITEKNNLDTLISETNEPILLLILDGITDPHNLGACLRVANAAGVHAVIAPRHRSVKINSTVAKVSSGASDTIPYIRVTNLAKILRDLKKINIKIIGTVSDKNVNNLYSVNFTDSVAIVMGSEFNGIRHLTSEICDENIFIPMFGTIESLNVSVAAGICLFEAIRQRKIKHKYF